MTLHTPAPAIPQADPYDTPQGRQLAGFMLAVVLEAVEASALARAHGIADGLRSGFEVLSWVAPERARLPRGARDRALRVALGFQANRYDRQGLTISAQDCRWLAEHLSTGRLVLASATGEGVAE